MRENGGLLRNKLLLITGYARSGTTALSSGISLSNKLIFNEAGFLNKFQRHQSLASLKKHIEMRLKNRFIKYQKLDTERINRRLEVIRENGNRQEMIEATYNFLLEQDLSSVPFTEDSNDKVKTIHLNKQIKCQKNGKWWGDKVPKLLLHTNIEAIRKEWPDCKLIYIYRDGRDVVASHLRLGWLNPDKVWQEWADSLEALENLKMDSLVVKQEDLLQNISSVVLSINKYLGENVVDESDYQTFFYKKGIKHDSKSISSMIEKKRHVGYWKDYFTMASVPESAVRWLRKLRYI